MNYKKWQLHEAKNKLSELIDLSTKEGPQIITRDGENVAVVLSIKDFQNLQPKKTALSLSEFFRQSPMHRIKLNIKRSKDSGRSSDNF